MDRSRRGFVDLAVTVAAQRGSVLREIALMRRQLPHRDDVRGNELVGRAAVLAGAVARDDVVTKRALPIGVAPSRATGRTDFARGDLAAASNAHVAHRLEGWRTRRAESSAPDGSALQPPRRGSPEL